MGRAENLELIKRHVDAFNRQCPTYFDCYAGDCQFRGYPPQFGAALDTIREFYRLNWQAFPDGQTTIEDIVCEDDRAAVRATFRGTQRGEFMGKPGSARTVTVAMASFMRFRDGKITERWNLVDEVGLIRALEPEAPAAHPIGFTATLR